MVNRQSVEADLQAWAADILKCEVAVAPLAGDASFRRYYRLQTEQGGYIAAHAPPERENNEAFVAVQGLLASHGVRVPGLIAWQRERGFLLQRDFGDQLLLPSLTEDTVEPQYQAALDALLTLQSIPVSDAELPLYGEQKLREELDLFAEWFVTQLLGVEQSAVPHGLLDELFELLIASARSQPQVVVHRDYHSRNLMVLEDGELGVIDFQDAVVGPITYDLVSLLRDCYVEWPEAQVAGWALGYRDQLLRAERMPPAAMSSFCVGSI